MSMLYEWKILIRYPRRRSTAGYVYSLTASTAEAAIDEWLKKPMNKMVRDTVDRRFLEAEPFTAR